MEQEFKAIEALVNVELGYPNVLELTDFGIGMEAIGDKIIVLMDSYRSGYECTVCKGAGKVRQFSRCKCDPDEWNMETHLERGTKNRFGEPCDICGGNYLSKRVDSIVECPQCHGKGATLIIPDTAKSLPTTGIVVSIGPDADRSFLHKRILVGPYSGVFCPMKGNIPVKIYKEHEPLAFIYNINPEHGKVEEMVDTDNHVVELPVADFIDYDTPLADSQNI